MIGSAIALVLLAYAPGALAFRLPFAGRDRRAALAAEERVFWAIVVSVAWSLAVTLALATGGWYRLDRLLWITGGTAAVLAAASLGRLRLGSVAPRPTRTALLPAALAVVAATLTFYAPPAEYVMGGRDPGVYVHEGIQMAQRGQLIIEDPMVAAVPHPFRDLFFPSRNNPRRYSMRFMGFTVLDPESGAVAGQFPHLYPASIAVAYDIAGLNGARRVLSLWSILGVVAVYFLGARLFGRPAAAAGAALVAVHVVQVWYSRYPNAEILLQTFVFAGLLAYVRAVEDDHRFFRPVAGFLLPMGLFAHLTGVFVVGAAASAAVLARLNGRRLPWSLAVPFLATTLVAPWYYVTFLPTYSAMPVGFVRLLTPTQTAAIVALALAGLALWLGAAVPAIATRVRAVVPTVFLVSVLGAAGYAYLFRVAHGTLAPQDADALRTFTAFYLSPIGLVLSLVGLVVAVRRQFWTSAPLLVVLAVFSFVFFHKPRIIPEHFWAARRFLGVILPGLLLLAGAAAFTAWPAVPSASRLITGARRVIGPALIGVLAVIYLGATARIVRYVEYAGLIPQLERLASRFSENDLVLVESRNASDMHVLALPLAYTYGKNVLLFPRTDPNKGLFRGFLDWAHTRYERVFFIGGGGTEVLSRTTSVDAIAGERFQIPEYESEWNLYPTRSLRKEFDFGVYVFGRGSRPPGPFDLDVGVADDLYVRRFFAKETHADGFTFRWTSNVSYLSILGIDAGCRALTLWMSRGDRPDRAPSPDVAVSLADRRLGEVTVGRTMAPYVFEIPADLATTLSTAADAARVELTTPTWNPRALNGARDDRDLGVILDRVTACAPGPR